MEEIDSNSIKNYPQNWWLHVGPSSMEEVSKLHWFGRSLLLPIVQQSGWDMDPAGSLERYCQKVENIGMKGQVFIGVSGLHSEIDHYFPWKAGLCNSDKVMNLKKQGLIGEVLQFRPSHMEHHTRAHHALPMDAFDLMQMIDPTTGDFVVDPIDETKKTSMEKPFIPQENI